MWGEKPTAGRGFSTPEKRIIGNWLFVSKRAAGVAGEKETDLDARDRPSPKTYVRTCANAEAPPHLSAASPPPPTLT
jgi:hypothetical protein